MINQNLHRQPVALDSALHRKMTLGVPISDWSMAKELNAMFVAAVKSLFIGTSVCRAGPVTGPLPLQRRLNALTLARETDID